MTCLCSIFNACANYALFLTKISFNANKLMLSKLNLIECQVNKSFILAATKFDYKGLGNDSNLYNYS